MTTRRNAILSGAIRATDLHAELGLRDRLKLGDRAVDVLDVVHQLGVLLLFRPLTSLLGAYLPTAVGAGVLVTTQRDLHVQRFTAAHELGHHILQHKAASLDVDVGFVARGERTGYDYQELEADSFAAEFLLPKWLIVAHARRHNWGKSDLRNPDVVYQLSLRLGASYMATCWALLSNDLVDRPTLQTLLTTQPKECKQRALPDVIPSSWRRDVWLLSERDRGAHVLGGPDDMLVLSLQEHVNGGYIWDIDPISSAGFQIQKDERGDATNSQIGGPVIRRVIMQGDAHGHIRIEERRPWSVNDVSHATFEIDVAMTGSAPKGLPRARRVASA